MFANITIALQVGLSWSGLLPAVGHTTFLTAVVTGGLPPYAVSWPGLPAWCNAEGAGSAHPNAAACVPVANGTYPINVAVRDSAGRIANSSVIFTVGLGSSSSPPPGGSIEASPYLVLGVLGAAVIIAIAILVRRQPPSRGPSPVRQAGSDPYRDYRAPHDPTGDGDVLPLAEGESDPASDLF